MAETIKRLEVRKLSPEAMIGMSPDYGPRTASWKVLSELAPKGGWVDNSHNGWTGMRGSVPIGYTTRVYVDPPPPPAAWDEKRRSGWRSATHKGDTPNPNAARIIVDRFKRGMRPDCSLVEIRTYTEWSLLDNLSGIGRMGADFWPVLGGGSERASEKLSPTLTARHPRSTWDQLNMDRGTEYFLAPGPDGPVPTERFEMLREGVQECEARIFIEKALIDKAKSTRLGAELVKRCQETLDERAWHIRAATINTAPLGMEWYAGAGSAGLAEKLYAAAAAVAAKLGTP